MVNFVKGWEIAKAVEDRHKVYVRSFSSSSVRGMKDYMKPTLRENDPDHILLHVGTNELSSDKEPELIAKSIIDLGKPIKKKNCGFSVSGIIPRNDEWNEKASQVNDNLRSLCIENEIDFIDHTNTINCRKHLNNSKLHLNPKGTQKLSNNFLEFIKNMSNS